MLAKIIEIATPGTHLSVQNGQLRVERPECPEVTLPISDIGVVILDERRLTYTHAVLAELIGAGVALLVTDAEHLPAGMMIPLAGHHALTQRHLAQVQAGQDAKDCLWARLIRSKIAMQGQVLHDAHGNDAGLQALSRRVLPGDPDNLEAQAAQRYWPRLMGDSFRRDRTQEGLNALLNYGYAVLRAAVARAVVASGLIPSIGIFHKNRSNPFCLADDLMEPYRPIIDATVERIGRSHKADALTLADRSIRATLIGVLGTTIEIGGVSTPIMLAIESSAKGLARALTLGTDQEIHLPTALQK